MMLRTVIERLFQRSSLLRFLVLPAMFLAFSGLVGGIVLLANRSPVLESISPSIAESGDVIVLQGRHFGKERGDAWIEIAGNRLSGSSYLDWTDTAVMAILPQTAEDGLVYVCTRTSRSNPLIFANRSSIPVAATTSSEPGLPVISSIDANKAATGKRITVLGRNFGIARNKSSVLFTWQIDPAIPVSGGARSPQQTIACSEHDFDYEFWSDQELRVRVPDGATSGNIWVQTDRGVSNPVAIEIADQPGTRQFHNRRTYVLSMEVNISGVTASEGNMLFLRVPVPQETAAQRGVEVTASSPEPYMGDYQGTILHQIENLKSGKNETISHSFLLNEYAVSTDIKSALVKPYTETKSPLYLMYTAPDRIVPSDNPDIILKAASIAGKEKNPYLKARLIFDWIAGNLKPAAVANPDRPVTEALSSMSGDAYDAAILFCAVSRAAGIPAVPVAGLLVDAQQKSRIHWWAEFYIEDFGWVPVDPGLGAGIPVQAEAPAGTGGFFGNLDSDHIAFSRGWSEEKPMTAKSRIVYKPRSFAFQPIWEESGGNIKGYTSFWGEPRITGVY